MYIKKKKKKLVKKIKLKVHYKSMLHESFISELWSFFALFFNFGISIVEEKNGDFFQTTCFKESKNMEVEWNLWITIKRSSHPEVFFNEGVLKNFANFTGKQLCQGLFFNKVAELRLKLPFYITF